MCTLEFVVAIETEGIEECEIGEYGGFESWLRESSFMSSPRTPSPSSTREFSIEFSGEPLSRGPFPLGAERELYRRTRCFEGFRSLAINDRGALVFREVLFPFCP